jgi:glutamate formiminotransferase/formiminotetrahydrofolate cyclodeaminase
MDAFALPKSNEEEKAIRTAAIEAATQYAVEVPLKVMKLSHQSLRILSVMVNDGNPNSVSDAGVGVLCVRTAVQGAYMNVRINAKSLKDRTWADTHLAEAKAIADDTEKLVAQMIEVVEGKM